MGGSHLKQAIKDTESAGIEVAAIGILTDHVKEYYKTWATVNTVSDLAAATIKICREMLIGRKP
jgi:cobalamin biosynthesis protein CobT